MVAFSYSSSIIKCMKDNSDEGAIPMCSSSTHTVCPNYKCLAPSGPMEILRWNPFTLRCPDCGIVVQTVPYYEENKELLESTRKYKGTL